MTVYPLPGERGQCQIGFDALPVAEHNTPEPPADAAADVLARYRRETGGLLDTHPGLVAKPLTWVLDLDDDFTDDEIAALRAATFEATE